MKHRYKQNLRAAALASALGVTTVCAQTDSGLQRPLTLASADATSSGGGGARAESEAEQNAELVKKILNPIADLTRVPFQNNWDFGIITHPNETTKNRTKGQT